MTDTLDEDRRLAALRRYRLLDTAPEPRFDAIVEKAAATFNTSIALISLVDEDRQWFKARVGVEMEESARESSFCTFAIERDDVMVVPDATVDIRFTSNPLVRNAPHVRFYAGAPLIDAEGHRIGTLCVLDQEPHKPFTDIERSTLESLAAIVMAEIEHRRSPGRPRADGRHGPVAAPT